MGKLKSITVKKTRRNQRGRQTIRDSISGNKPRVAGGEGAG